MAFPHPGLIFSNKNPEFKSGDGVGLSGTFQDRLHDRALVDLDVSCVGRDRRRCQGAQLSPRFRFTTEDTTHIPPENGGVSLRRHDRQQLRTTYDSADPDFLLKFLFF